MNTDLKSDLLSLANAVIHTRDRMEQSLSAVYQHPERDPEAYNQAVAEANAKNIQTRLNRLIAISDQNGFSVLTGQLASLGKAYTAMMEEVAGRVGTSETSLFGCVVVQELNQLIIGIRDYAAELPEPKQPEPDVEKSESILSNGISRENAANIYSDIFRNLATEYEQEADKLRDRKIDSSKAGFIERSHRPERAGNAIIGAFKAGVLNVPGLAELVEYHQAPTPVGTGRQAEFVRGAFNLFYDVVGDGVEEFTVGPNGTLTDGCAVDGGLISKLNLGLTHPTPYYESLLNTRDPTELDEIVLANEAWRARRCAVVLRAIANLVESPSDSNGQSESTKERMPESPTGFLEGTALADAPVIHESPTERFHTILKTSVAGIIGIVNKIKYAPESQGGYILGDADSIELTKRVSALMLGNDRLYRSKTSAENSVSKHQFDRYCRISDEAAKAYQAFCQSAWLLDPRSSEWKKSVGRVMHSISTLEETRNWAMPLKPLTLEDLTSLTVTVTEGRERLEKLVTECDLDFMRRNDGTLDFPRLLNFLRIPFTNDLREIYNALLAWNDERRAIGNQNIKSDAPPQTTKTNGKSKAKKKPKGRPSDTDHDQDRRIWEAWETGRYRTFADLAKEFRMDTDEVKAAKERHRKRNARKK